MRVVALLTDFGTKDHYVGVVKGKILCGLTPSQYPVFVDITHEIPPQDVLKGALALFFAYKYFPKGTIFLCVVDPGVGTERKAIILQTEEHTFVGPDNGLFSYIIKKETIKACFEIDKEKVLEPPYSSTFHARDLFAPVIARLIKGEDLKGFTKELPKHELIVLPLPKVVETEDGLVVPIIDVDRFGNLITALHQSACQRKFKVLVNEREIPLVSSYAYAQKGELIALFGSEGFLEIAVREGSAFELLGIPKVKVVWMNSK